MFRQKLIALDWNKWFKNTAIFFAPVVLLYLVFVQVNINTNGFQTTDFYPTSEVIGGMILYITNTVIDFIKKFIVSNPQE